MAATVQFIAGSNKEKYTYQKGGKFTCVSKLFGKGFEADDVSSVELQPMQNTATTGRAVAGAALGGAALGGAGLIAGALVGGKKSEALVTFYFKDGGRALGKCNAPMLEALQVLIFEGRIREGNPYAGLTMEHDEKTVGTTPEEEAAAPGTAPHKEVTTIPAPPKGMTDEFGNVKAPKKKGSMGKKIFNAFAVIFLLCVIIAKFGGTEEKTSTESAPAQATANQPAQNNPCAEIKTAADWEKAETFWRIGNPQCMPKGQSFTFSWDQKDIETFVKKTTPSYRSFGGYKLVFERNNDNWCAVACVFPKSISQEDMKKVSLHVVRTLQNFFEANGKKLIISARAYGKGQAGDMVALNNPFDKNMTKTVFGYDPKYADTIKK